jgi:beta-galactosidase
MTPRKVLLPLVAACLASSALAATPTATAPGVTRDAPFDEGWRFHRGEAPGAHQASFDDSSWRSVDLPHDWSIENLPPGDAAVRSGPFDRELSAGKASTGWVVGGTGWYRKRFRLSPLADRHLEVRFDGVYMDSEVWLNGRILGRQPYGYSSFVLDLTPHAVRGDNVLAVHVRNEGQNSRWYSGSGLYRHVWLTTTGPLRVPVWGVTVTTPEVTPARARVSVAVDLSNGGRAASAARVRVTLVGPGGEAVGRGEAPVTVPGRSALVATVTMDVAVPRLWSPDAPALYRASVEVVASGHVADRVEQPFGIRRVEIDAQNGLRLNGVPYEMKGACVHHDNGPLGAAAIDRAEVRRVEILKAAGFNAIRTSHNPPSPAFLDAADRLGMLVIDEAFDMWERPKNPQDYHRFFEEWWARDLAAMVRRDRNHPSVVLWSIGNEVNERADPSGLEIARRLIAGARRDDPTRGVTNAICHFWDHKDRPWADTRAAFALLDVGGYNYQWREYESDHAASPGRVMAGTESFPLEAFESWDAVVRLPYVIGDFVWTGWDYLGESGIGRAWVEGEEKGDFLGEWPWHVSGCGDIDVLGHRKPQSYYREALWRKGVLQAAVHRPLPEGRKEKTTKWGWPDVQSHWTWPGQEGKAIGVSVYSSCDRVALRLNGAAVGEMPTTRAERHRADFEVIYQPGELEASCVAPGDSKARVELRTSGAPARLRLVADRPEIRASRDDLSYVGIEVVDAQGVVVPGAQPEIRASVKGAGELAALASADPVDVTGFRGPSRRAYRGEAQAILRPTGAGRIELVVEAEGLPPASLTIVAR